MTESYASAPEADPVRTGVPDIDAVLESLEGLEASDVAGHPAVFEAAHERLRAALDTSA